jgi:D-alanyl-D-alanine carboxypeptidase
MRLSRTIALFLCIVFISAFLFGADAAGSQDNAPLLQCASELSQYTGLKYYRNEDTQRYIDYKLLHTDYAWETVVTYVNIGLDYSFYTNTVMADDPAALDVLVNKYRYLPPDYVPRQLETVSAAYSSGTQKLTHDTRLAFQKMCADAKKLGYSLYAISSYRSYDRQLAVYNSFYDPNNPASAVTQELTAARPGFSEHQTGLAVDVASNRPLTNSAVFKWYSKNAHKYGFIVRYPSGYETILGITNEPWHLRYLGVPLATAVYKSGLTYDEYYAREIGLPQKSADTYAVGVTSSSDVTVPAGGNDDVGNTDGGNDGPSGTAAPSGGKTATLSTFGVQDTAYYRLRDIAVLLNGTALQFDIAWDASTGRIALLPGAVYTGDPALSSSESGKAVLVAAKRPGLQVGKSSDELSAYELSAYALNGTNYFKLDDILTLLGLSASDGGAGVLVIAPGPAPQESPSPSPSPSEPPELSPAA